MAKLPSMYVTSKLFPRGRLHDGLKKTTLPDESEEDLHPDPHGIEGAVQETKKAVAALKLFLDMVKAGADQESSGRVTMEDEGQAKREWEHDLKKYPRGVGSADTPDLPEVGRDWHGDSTPDDKSDDVDDEEDLDRVAPQHSKLGKGQAAVDTLDRMPRFSSGPIVPPREREFLLEKGFSDDEISSGRVHVTPRMRSEFSQYLLGVVRKSISGLVSWRG